MKKGTTTDGRNSGQETVSAQGINHKSAERATKQPENSGSRHQAKRAQASRGNYKKRSEGKGNPAETPSGIRFATEPRIWPFFLFVGLILVGIFGLGLLTGGWIF